MKENKSAKTSVIRLKFAFNKKSKNGFKRPIKNLFPDHEPSEEMEETVDEAKEPLDSKEPMICKFEKRKGKPTTIIEGYTGADEDFKILAKELKTKLSVGGTFKDDSIIIQGDYRDKIMAILKEKGFKVKRVGG